MVGGDLFSQNQPSRGIRLTEKQRLSWLRLIRSDNVGPATFRELINNFGSADRALEMLPELSQRGGSKRPVRVASLDEALQEMEYADKFGAKFIGIGEPEYPSALRQIDGAPPLIAVKGNLDVALRPSLAIVGSRNASVAGVKMTQTIAHEMAKTGYTITSGLARGIDTASHQASKNISTIAVLAGGLDKPYPPENRQLYDELCEGAGLVVTEMKFGWKPIARDFPRRNRIVAGISLGLLVVEAAKRSGSLISARLAADYGRLVFAIPGSPLDPRAAGTNHLIRDGAILTTSAKDIIEALAPISQLDLFEHPIMKETERNDQATLQAPDDNIRARVLSALGATPVDIDDLIRHTDIPPQMVYLILLELDLAGKLNRHSGGCVSYFHDA